MNERFEKTKKPLWLAARIIMACGMFALCFYLLWRFEYITQLPCVDNFIGSLPVILIIIAFAAFVALLFVPHNKRNIVVCICLAVVMTVSFALFPNALIGNWWIDYGKEISHDAEPPLWPYTPFAQDNMLATAEFDGEKLSSDLPQLDGAIALYPLYAAFAQAFYDRDGFFAEGGYASETYKNDGERVIMTNTLRAYDGIIDGTRDIIFVAGASEAQRKKAASAGVELTFTPIGKEAFVFIVPQSNPLNDLSYQQIKNVYSGKTSKWRTLGWADGGDIVSFRRPEGSGSQTGLQAIMGDIPLTVTQPLPDRSLIGTDSLMTQMTVTYNGVQPALGYSYKYFATRMYSNPDTKLLSINGVSPTAENISNGSYPFTVNFYAVTRGEPTGNTKILIDHILSDAGQEIIEKTGYARLASFEKQQARKLYVDCVY